MISGRVCALDTGVTTVRFHEDENETWRMMSGNVSAHELTWKRRRYGDGRYGNRRSPSNAVAMEPVYTWPRLIVFFVVMETATSL